MINKGKSIEITWLNRLWLLDARRALIQNDLKLVILSDIHIGLYSSFRAQGSYLPTYDQKELVEKLQSLFIDYFGYQWIIAGDIKHNHSDFSNLTGTEKTEIADMLEMICSNVNNLKLLKGNHDRGLEDLVNESKLKCTVSDQIQIENFLITHNIELNTKLSKKYSGVIFGHIHPITNMFLKGIKIPVFVVKGNMIILPSFNKLSGGVKVNKLNFGLNNEKLQLFGIINDLIMSLPL